MGDGVFQREKIRKPRAKPMPGPVHKAAAQREVGDLLRFVRDYTRVSRLKAEALLNELHAAYSEANFGTDGPHVPSLDEADILLAVAHMLERDWGRDVTGHAELERRVNAK